ncbi:MAG: type II restriction endonuclease [Clostridiales bacterium]|nr:type II restriction endonuclease [Roseburia sp.]MDD7636142.1 type II restriction endonuclease [Clostridiales bacterium]MDY4112741.1 type II restriction endonuclease [Roseburia sp.]
MAKRDFDDWLSTFTDNINSYTYYVDFAGVYANAQIFKRELALMQTLIGSKNIREEFKNLVNDYPEVLKCIPILLALRESVVAVTDEDGRKDYNFKCMNYSLDDYCDFMEKTGLFDLLANHVVSNLYDLAGLGINIGLSSNGRKNRGGHQMEDLVESYIVKAGFVKDKSYFKEMYLTEIEDKWGYNLTNISAEGTSTKRFDFVIKPEGSANVYVCECNCYSSGGSKLNETARSFKTIALETEGIPNVHFVWFTDGEGWKSARRNLKETFDVLEDIYNINDMDNGIIKKIFV